MLYRYLLPAFCPAAPSPERSQHNIHQRSVPSGRGAAPQAPARRRRVSPFHRPASSARRGCRAPRNGWTQVVQPKTARVEICVWQMALLTRQPRRLPCPRCVTPRTCCRRRHRPSSRPSGASSRPCPPSRAASAWARHHALTRQPERSLHGAHVLKLRHKKRRWRRPRQAASPRLRCATSNPCTGCTPEPPACLPRRAVWSTYGTLFCSCVSRSIAHERARTSPKRRSTCEMAAW